jgi:SAM-dependent methyltransferase
MGDPLLTANEYGRRLEVFVYTDAHQLLAEEIESKTGRHDLGWHYSLDYAYALAHFDPMRHHRILDVGSGPYGNALHDYLESVHARPVVALDRRSVKLTSRRRLATLWRSVRKRQRFDLFRVDWVGELLDFGEPGWDFMVAVSSLEHNPAEGIRRAWKHAARLLSDTGTLVATFSIAVDGVTRWDEESSSVLLSLEDAQNLWECEYSGDLDQVIASYDNPYLRKRHAERFGSRGREYPAYLAAGTLITSRNRDRQ